MEAIDVGLKVVEVLTALGVGELIRQHYFSRRRDRRDELAHLHDWLLGKATTLEGLPVDDRRRPEAKLLQRPLMLYVNQIEFLAGVVTAIREGTLVGRGAEYRKQMREAAEKLRPRLQAMVDKYGYDDELKRISDRLNQVLDEEFRAKDALVDQFVEQGHAIIKDAIAVVDSLLDGTRVSDAAIYERLKACCAQLDKGLQGRSDEPKSLAPTAVHRQ